MKGFARIRVGRSTALGPMTSGVLRFARLEFYSG
jgi:hypothetical protein